MNRGALILALFVAFIAFVSGCGGGPKVKKGEDPFKSRADTQSPEKKDSYMKPGNPPSPVKAPAK